MKKTQKQMKRAKTTNKKNLTLIKKEYTIIFSFAAKSRKPI